MYLWQIHVTDRSRTVWRRRFHFPFPIRRYFRAWDNNNNAKDKMKTCRSIANTRSSHVSDKHQIGKNQSITSVPGVGCTERRTMNIRSCIPTWAPPLPTTVIKPQETEREVNKHIQRDRQRTGDRERERERKANLHTESLEGISNFTRKNARTFNKNARKQTIRLPCKQQNVYNIRMF